MSKFKDGIKEVLSLLNYEDLRQFKAFVESIAELEDTLGHDCDRLNYLGFVAMINHSGEGGQGLEYEGGQSLEYLRQELTRLEDMVDGLKSKTIQPSDIIGKGIPRPRESALERLLREIGYTRLSILTGGLINYRNIGNYAAYLRSKIKAS